jgi:hypothetical protein
MSGLELVESGPEDRQRAEYALGREITVEHIYVIVAAQRRYLLVGGSMTVSENDLPLNQTMVERV